MPLAAVLGSPIAHALSPVLHQAAYAELGLTSWTYAAYDADRPHFAAFMAGCDAQVCGLSLTMPLKEVAFEVATWVSDDAKLTGAINTLVRRPGGWHGHNTDITGILEALRGPATDAAGSGVVAPGGGIRDADSAGSATGGDPGAGPPLDAERATSASPLDLGSRGLILGAGATARSALVALAHLGVREVVVAARDPRTAQESLGDLASALPVRLQVIPLRDWPRAGASVVVSTLPPAGAADAAAVLARVRGGGPHVLDGGPQLLDGGPHVLDGVRLLDVVYANWPTPLASAAIAAGAEVISGLAMLVHQAVDQVELMTGQRPSATVLRAAGQAALARR